MNWENKAVKIYSEHLSHLTFSDDIVLIANSTSKLQEMLQDIHDISKPVGLKMHLGKTNVICNKHVNKDDVIVDGKKIDEVDRYVYLGQMMMLRAVKCPLRAGLIYLILYYIITNLGRERIKGQILVL